LLHDRGDAVARKWADQQPRRIDQRLPKAGQDIVPIFGGGVEGDVEGARRLQACGMFEPSLHRIGRACERRRAQRKQHAQACRRAGCLGGVAVWRTV
jgi:hypothetical protein